MMTMPRCKTLLVGAILLTGLFGTGCETGVDPFIEDDRFFSVYGYLDTATDLQAVRVVALRTSLGGATTDAIDATVTTTELETGRVVEWTDSVIEFADGSTGHVFRGAMRPIPGYSYRLDVVRSDGASATATTTIPLATQARVDAPTVASTSVFQKVFWSGIPVAPFRIEVWYRFMGQRPGDPFLDAVITYQDVKFGSAANGGWEILVRHSDDREKVYDAIGTSVGAGLTLLGMGARLTMQDDAWRPPGGVFDREVLVQPGTFSNVDGGFGYFGSVNQYTVEWTLSQEVTERIGYFYPR